MTVTNACGSHVALAEVEEEYCGCHIWVPTAFTPDRDGVNEGFRIVSTCDWTEFSFKIFNRWGQQVWSTNDPTPRGTEAPTTWVAETTSCPTAGTPTCWSGGPSRTGFGPAT